MARELVVLGGGEHARVVIEAALTCPERWRVLGYASGSPVEETERRLGVRWIGTDDQTLAEHPGALFVLGAGSLEARARIAARFAGCAFACILHRDATVSPTAALGPGTVVLARAVVNTGARLGGHVIVNTGAIVEHDVELGDHVHVGPGAAIGGGASVGHATHVGLGARVRDHVAIGARVTVGMGAAVVGKIPDGATVVGVPARALTRPRR